MSENFSRRSFLKGSAAFVGAAALASTMGGCSTSKTTITGQGVRDNDPESEDFLLGGDNNGISASRSYSIGGGLELSSMIGVLCTKPRSYPNKYPGLTMFLQNTSDKDLVINVSQFTDVRFNGSPVSVAGLKIAKSSAEGVTFEQTLPLPAKANGKNGTVTIRLYLDAPAPDLAMNGQPISFVFTPNGTTKKVRVSGACKDKATFTITY